MFYCIGWTFLGILSSSEERFQIQPKKSVNTLIQWGTAFCSQSANQLILTEPKSSLRFPLIESHLWHIIEPIWPKKIFMNPKPTEKTLPKVLKIKAMISRRRTPARICKGELRIYCGGKGDFMATILAYNMRIYGSKCSFLVSVLILLVEHFFFCYWLAADRQLG